MNDSQPLTSKLPNDNTFSVDEKSHGVNLESKNDDQIKTLISESYKLLDQRKREREKAIKEQIKSLAASEGIKVSFSDSPGRKPKIKKDA